jgi:hypothetical protein
MLDPRFVNDGNGYKNLKDAKCQNNNKKKNPIVLGPSMMGEAMENARDCQNDDKHNGQK